ncbi:MAG: IclR family transcriptional regulator [Candidatus Thorarchaeota archaeon]|jgi:DNA-binding IclR family transcriptional regulator
MPEKRKIFNRSLERALNILCAFSSQNSELKLTDLSQNLGLPKSTVFRLCSTLVEYDFLKYDKNQKRYSLGLKLFDLGGIVSSSFSLRKAASNPMTELQKKSGESVFLGILQDDQLLYLDKRDAPDNPIKFATEIGTRRQPFFGMLGQILLAFLPDREVSRILDENPLQPITKKSITTRKALGGRLQTIREQGFAVERGEVIDGVGGIAAPIRDCTGKVVAAVGLRFLATSGGEGRVRELIGNVCKTAKRISADLGYKEE